MITQPDPYTIHQDLAKASAAFVRTRRRQRRFLTTDNFVASWGERPILCRLMLHRPVVFADRLRYDGAIRPMPHCGRCGYRWTGDP